MIHGITIREKSTKKLIDFIPCPVGTRALYVLSGVRRNLGSDYDAQEELVNEAETNIINGLVTQHD